LDYNEKNVSVIVTDLPLRRNHAGMTALPSSPCVERCPGILAPMTCLTGGWDLGRGKLGAGCSVYPIVEYPWRGSFLFPWDVSPARPRDTRSVCCRAVQSYSELVTAAAASTRPAPNWRSVPLPPRSTLVFSISATAFCGVIPGWDESMRARVPETCGAALPKSIQALRSLHTLSCTSSPARKNPLQRKNRHTLALKLNHALNVY